MGQSYRGEHGFTIVEVKQLRVQKAVDFIVKFLGRENRVLCSSAVPAAVRTDMHPCSKYTSVLSNAMHPWLKPMPWWQVSWRTSKKASPCAPCTGMRKPEIQYMQGIKTFRWNESWRVVWPSLSMTICTSSWPSVGK